VLISSDIEYAKVKGSTPLLIISFCSEDSIGVLWSEREIFVNLLLWDWYTAQASMASLFKVGLGSFGLLLWKTTAVRHAAYGPR
jgi:hypothetical protein